MNGLTELPGYVTFMDKLAASCHCHRTNLSNRPSVISSICLTLTWVDFMKSAVDKGNFWWRKNCAKTEFKSWSKTYGQFANVVPYHPGVLYFSKGPLSEIFDIISYKIWNVIYLDIISYYRQYWFRSFSPKLNFEILVFLFRSEDAGWFQCNHPKSSEPPAEPRLNIRLNRCGNTRYTVL